MIRRTGRVDGNQSDLVRALTSAHWSVQTLAAVGGGVPDLLCGGNMPCVWCRRPNRSNLLIEAKTGNGTLTPDQERWHRDWRGQVAIARTMEEALKIAGIEVGR